MASFKFFNIGKANEEITRLEGELAKVTAERDALQSNDGEVTAAAEKIKGELAAANAKIVQFESDLATARQSIATLTTERDAAQAEQKAAEEKLSALPQKVKEAASVQAAVITAQLGQPAVAAAPSTAPGGNEPKTWAEKAIAAAETKAAKRAA